MPSLSKAQRQLLAEVADAKYGPKYAVEWYPPVQKLLALGYIKSDGGSDCKWVVTEAGKAALAKIKSKP